MTGYIYQLVCPIKNEPIYVGSTIRELNKRLSAHLTFSKTERSPLYLYIRENNITPTIVLLSVIENTSKPELTKNEDKWIKLLSKKGYVLLNKNAAFGSAKVSIKLSSKIVKKVANYIKNKPITISKFFEQAAEEKLKKEKSN